MKITIHNSKKVVSDAFLIVGYKSMAILYTYTLKMDLFSSDTAKIERYLVIKHTNKTTEPYLKIHIF